MSDDVDKTHRFRELAKRLAALPPMTPREQELQAMSFAYGNLACTTNHRPSRKAFKAIALERGWSEIEFEIWANERTWW